jgi:hypothetical protein
VYAKPVSSTEAGECCDYAQYWQRVS